MIIPFEIGSRSRLAKEGGWKGRRRNYRCRKCGAKFQHDGFQLIEAARICPSCRGASTRPLITLLEFSDLLAQVRRLKAMGWIRSDRRAYLLGMMRADLIISDHLFSGGA